MKVSIIGEYGFHQALLGIGLSYGITSNKTIDDIDNDRELRSTLIGIAEGLIEKGGSHVKFLESMGVWIDMTAPRYFWTQFSTYRIGISAQSESTMHTMVKRPLTNKDFSHHMTQGLLDTLNLWIRQGSWETVKWNLPESFLQRRIVHLNYKSLSNIIRQRKHHRLEEWPDFIKQVKSQVGFPEFLDDEAVTG